MNDISSEPTVRIETVEVHSPRPGHIGFHAAAHGTDLYADDAPAQEIFRERARAIGIAK